MEQGYPSCTDTNALEQYVEATVEKESEELRGLICLVTDALSLKITNGEIISDSKLTSEELEILAMKIPAECLRLQVSLNRYSTRNIFRDLAIEADITKNISSLLGTKGNADERKRRAELLLLDERTANAVNKAIVRGLQGCIERADKVYEGIKKVLDYRAREGWFDRKGPN